MIEQASEAANQVKAAQSDCLMEIMKSEDLSQEQKIKIIELLNPLDKAISEAQAAFLFDVK
ncbi:MAG: hypothetical protein GY815_11910 [Gammaproteobacteria bacterium]|nr:hypothetical protein [Gammaproteobacteria bacterium]